MSNFARSKSIALGTALVLSTSLIPAMSAAATLAGVGEYTGNAGIGTPNGDVVAPPVGGKYVYVTTAGGVAQNGLGEGSETTGSVLTTNSFSASAGDVLSYYFNFVTSDGSGYADYGWAQLLNAADDSVAALIFTARTKPSGNIVPGFDLPALSPGVTLNPATASIIGGAPTWSELGGSSGSCYSSGCGYTGWVQSTFTVATAGSYKFSFGAVNWADGAYQTGMAISGLKIGNTDIITNPGSSTVPLPAGAWLLGTGIGALAVARRRRTAAKRG